MVDTLHLALAEGLTVQRDAPVRIVPTTLETSGAKPYYENTLYELTDGTPVKGQRAYYNEGELHLDFTERGKYAHFSVPGAFRYGNNYSPLIKSEAFELIERLNTMLERDGIYTDLLKAALLRVDLFVNVEIDHAFELYDLLFDHLGAKRMHGIKYRTTYRLYLNTLRQLCFYDKRAQMLDQKKNFLTVGLPEKVMRVEYRMLKRAKCVRDLGCETLGELIEKWDDLPDIYRSKLQELFFRFPETESMSGVSVSDEFGRMLWLKRQFGSGWYHKYLMLHAFTSVLDSFPDRAALRRAKLDLQSKQAVSYDIRLMDKLLMEVSPLIGSELTLADLYSELRRKLLTS